MAEAAAIAARESRVQRAARCRKHGSRGRRDKHGRSLEKARDGNWALVAKEFQGAAKP
jgi:hypothetical protein